MWIERDGQRVRATVVLASGNENSLLVTFDDMFHGYVAMMPLLRTDGEYCDLIEGKPVKVEKADA